MLFSDVNQFFITITGESLIDSYNTLMPKCLKEFINFVIERNTDLFVD